MNAARTLLTVAEATDQLQIANRVNCRFLVRFRVPKSCEVGFDVRCRRVSATLLQLHSSSDSIGVARICSGIVRRAGGTRCRSWAPSLSSKTIEEPGRSGELLSRDAVSAISSRPTRSRISFSDKNPLGSASLGGFSRIESVLQGTQKMPEIELGSHTIQSHGFKVAKTHKHDWLILLLLVVIEAILLMIEPFHRFAGEDMMTDMKYPLKGNTVPFWAVPILAIVVPFVVFLVYYFNRKDVYDFHHAILGLLFSVLLTAVITDAIKDTVGRPRPDFFWRCFPDGKGVFDPITKDVICHGDNAVIKEGYKSFPSGHTSWSFAGLSYLSWYLAGKIRAFDRRGHIAKLCIILFPLLLAALVAISRVDDYWHHWQDVFAGALIGSVIAAFCYLQFFPYPSDMNGWAPHTFFQMMEERNRAHSSGERVSSFHPQQAEVEASFMRRNNGMVCTESSSREYDTTPVLDAMEAGRK